FDAIEDAWEAFGDESKAAALPTMNVIAYCVTSATNRENSIGRPRKQKIVSLERGCPNPFAPSSQEPIRILGDRELVCAVLDRIDHLPDRQREAIVRVGLLHQSYREIAAGIYGEPPTLATMRRVNALIHRARETLWHEFGKSDPPGRPRTPD